MTLRELVFDLGDSSQLGTLAPDSTLFFQVGEHALVSGIPETSSAGVDSSGVT